MKNHREHFRSTRVGKSILGALAGVSLLVTGLAPVALAEPVPPMSGGESSTETTSPEATVEVEEGVVDSDNSEASGSDGSQTDPKLNQSAQGSQSTARAAGDLPLYLNLTKLVDGVEFRELKPGDMFTYSYQMTASQADLTGITVGDVLPDLSGFELVPNDNTVEGIGADRSIDYTVAWSGVDAEGDPVPYDGSPETLSKGDGFQVNINGTLPKGQSITLTLQLKVPESFSPDDYRNDANLVNTATASNPISRPVESSATVKVKTDIKSGVELGKTWVDSDGKSTQAYKPGAESTINLKATSKWNVGIDKMVVTDPTEGAPFNNFDFVDFGNVMLPAGADQVQVDTWDGTSWISGTPGATAALPADVVADQVQGLRFTFTNSEGSRIAAGASSDISFKVKQRETPRDGSATDMSLGYATTNKAGVETTREGSEPARGESSADFKVTPVEVGVSVAKSFDPTTVSKGIPTTGTITATNGSSPVNTLTVEDQTGFFDGNTFAGDKTWVRQFAGFEAVDYPEGATSGTVAFTFGDGSTCTVAFASGTAPSAADCNPGRDNADVTGFKFVFAAAEGKNSIPGDASTSIKFAVNTNSAAGEENTDGYTKLDDNATFQGWKKDNLANAEAKTADGRSKTDNTKAELTVLDPWIKVTEKKSILPSAPVLPGQQVIAELETTAKTSPGTKVTDLTITDEWSGAAETCAAATDFWDAFNMTSVLPTQVHDGYDLTVNVLVNGGWVAIDVPLQGSAFYELDEAGFAAALAGLSPAAKPSDVTGVQFVYTKAGDAAGAEDFKVTPYVGFTARTVAEGLRSTVEGSNCAIPTTGGDNQPSKVGFTNTVVTNGTGQPPNGGEPVKDDSEGVDQGEIVNPDSGTDPGTYIFKQWNKKWVLELSRDSRTTRLDWGVSPGFRQVTIADTTSAEAGPGPVSQTVFDAFNLTGVATIKSDDAQAFSNGWYLKWDTITSIELFNGTAWVTPTGSWTGVNGFSGLSLTADEQKSTLGIRINLAENTEARTAAQAAGDPLAPKPGTGVASGGGVQGNGTARTFSLNWQLRDTTRSGDPVWVTRESILNVKGEDGQGKEGQVRNDAELVATPEKGDVQKRTTHDTIQILGTEPAVEVTKTVSPESVVVPDPASGIAQEDYPKGAYTITAENISGDWEGEENRGVSLAQCIWLVDPAFAAAVPSGDNVCTAANPWGNAVDGLTADLFEKGKLLEPFNWQNVTGVTLADSKNGEVDWAGSKVYFLYFKDGKFSTGAATLDAGSKVATPGAGYELSNVVGVSAVFSSLPTADEPAGGGGKISNGNKLTIKVDTQVRDTYRQPVDEDTFVKAGESESVDNTVSGLLSRADGKKATDSGNAKLTFTGEKVDVNPTKAISPATVNEPAKDQPITVSLKADQGDKGNASSPKQVVLEDYKDSAKFWDAVLLTSVKTVTFPAGADQVKIDAHVRGADWTEGAQQGSDSESWTLPAGVAAEDVDGLRFTFTNEAGTVFSSTNDPTWSAQVDLEFKLPADAAFPSGPFVNTLYAQSFGVNSKSDEKSHSDELELGSGTRVISVGKLTNNGIRQVKGGSTIPWDLVVENSGTGYVDLTKIEDQYPEQLLYTGTDSGGGPGITYTDLAGGAVDEPQVELGEGTVTFNWEGAENTRLAPGEKVQIRLWLQLQASAAIPDEDGNVSKVENHFNVVTGNKLDGVGRYEFYDAKGKPIGQPANAEGVGEDGGESWDNVSVTSQLAVQITKGVRGPENGLVSGAVNLETPDAVCPTFQGNDGQSYYPTPCVANSQQGEVDDWVLRVANSGGTTGFKEIWVFDAMPQPEDLMLVTGERGSEFRPVLTGIPTIVPNPEMAGASYNWMDYVSMYVTTSDVQVCKGTWDAIAANGLAGLPDGPCTQNGETWQPVALDGSDFSDWDKVTGLRIKYSIDNEAPAEFPPGWVADIVYSTKNVLKDDADYSKGAQDVIPVDPSQEAWNQFGLAFIPVAGQGAQDRLASGKVGTRLLSGSVQVTKEVVVPETGDMGSYLPKEITATMTCAYQDGEPYQQSPRLLSFANGSAEDATKLPVKLVWDATLNEGKGGYAPVRVSGVPVGTSCTVVEDGEVGSFGEVVRDPAQATMKVTVPDTEFDEDGNASNAVPEGQIGKLSNVYEWGSLSVTKKVTTEATSGTFGPFDFELSCTTGSGGAVKFGDADKATFALAKDQTWTAPENTIPAGSTCELVETNRDGATTTVITGDNVTDNGAGTATIKVGRTSGESAVISTLVDNQFPAGTLTVAKQVEGEGAGSYGAGKFQFSAECTYKGESLLKETFELAGGETKTFGTYPVGTVCDVKELSNGGATTSVLNPADGKVTIAGPSAGSEAKVGAVTVAATNTFDLGSLVVNKVRDGEGAETYGVGPFEAQVSCTYVKDGKTTDIALPNQGVVELSAANGYTATIPNLIVGAECKVEETEAADAHETTYDPESQTVVIPANAEGAQSSVAFTITNTFKVGSVKAEKVVTGSGAELYGAGPFTVQLACTYDKGGEATPIVLDNEGVAILDEANGYSTQWDDIYAGATCELVETDANGAHKSVVDPEGTFTVEESTVEEPKVVTVTNTFDAGSLEIIKKIAGDDAKTRGKGPFEAQVACEYQVGEETVAVELPNQGVVELSEANGYKAKFEGIYSGAECSVKETKNGGADSTTMDPKDGKITIVGDDTQTVTITNNFGKLPKTGATVAGVSILALVLLAGGGFVVARSRKGSGRHTA